MDKWFNELRGNFKLRIGLACIIAILALNTVLDKRSALDLQKTQYRQISNQAARFQQSGDLTKWPQRAAATEAVRAKLEESLWKFPTLGLAQAGLQDWLVQTLSQAKIAQPNVNLVEESEPNQSASPNLVDATEAAANDIAMVKMKVDFVADAQTIQGLIATLQDNAKPWMFESLIVRRQLTNYKFEAVISTAVQLSSPVPVGVKR